MSAKGNKGRFGRYRFGKHLPAAPAQFPLSELLAQLRIKLVKFNDYNSVVNEFYIPTFVSLPRT